MMVSVVLLAMMGSMSSARADLPQEQIKSRVYELAANYRVIRVPTTAGSFDELVQWGNYNFVNPLVTEEHFPLGPVSQDGIDVVLLQFDHATSPREVFDEMLRLKVHPATMRELLALGVIRDQEHITEPVIAFGALWVDEEQVLHEAHMAGYEHGWVLNVGRPDHRYSKTCLFAAVIAQQ